MPYIVVDNFSGGLDKRRHVLNSKPGTLAVLKNAHVTRGGEIEKRKAFALYATLPTDWNGNGEKTVGLEATQDALYVFGSDQAPAFPAQTFPIGTNLPIDNQTLIKYQRLVHPDQNFFTVGWDEGIWNRWSTVFGGKIFVLLSLDPYPGPLGVGGTGLAFYDGQPIKDWYEGVNRSDWSQDVVDDFDVDGYSIQIVNVGPSVTYEIEGPEGKDYELDVSTTGGLVASVSKTQNAVPPIAEVLSTATFAISSGALSTVATCTKTVRYLSSTAYRIMNVYFDGEAAIEEPSGWAGFNWDSRPDPGGWNAGPRLGLAFDYYLANFPRNRPGFLSTPVGDASYSIRQASGTDYAYIKLFCPNTDGDYFDDHASLNGKFVEIEFDVDPTTIPSISELIETATIQQSEYNAGRWTARFGTLAGGTTNAVLKVSVDGVDMLGSPVKWKESHSSTMQTVVNRINTFVSAVEYTASLQDNKVVITADAGTGASPNGKSLEIVSSGNVSFSFVTNMSGGKDTVAGIPKKYEVEMSYDAQTAEIERKWTFTITDPDNPSVPKTTGATRVTNKRGLASMTYKSKEYVISGSTLYFSAVNDATKWDLYDTGSGFIDMSNNFGEREGLTGLGTYQDKLAVFSRRNVQLWNIDPDPSRNAQVQILSNTGCIAPGSIASIGSIDTLYLSDSGVRSLRARENTDSATSNDIGSAIDDEIANQKKTGGLSGNPLLESQIKRASAIIEPVDGRYWLAIHDKIYVLSYYPSANISAWSVYEPGFVVDEMVTYQDRVFLRSGNSIYMYGAKQNRPLGHIGNQDFTSEYDDCEVVVELPYLDGNKPATFKQSQGIDLTCEGVWSVEVGFDHTAPSARDTVAIVGQSTYATGKIPMTGYGTHFGMRFRSQAEGYSKLASVIVHFDEMHSKHDAG